MLASLPLIGFIPIRDAAQARGFYEGVLGFSVISDDGFALVIRTDTSMIRLVKMKEFTPNPYTILGWETRNMNSTVRELASRGVKFQNFGMPGQDEQGIWTTPSGDKVAWFKDPDGNTLSVSQH